MRRPGSMAVAVSRALYEEGMTRRAVAAASPEPTPNTDATKMSAVTGRRSVVHSGARSGRHPDRGPWVLTREHPGTSARVRSAHRGAEGERGGCDGGGGCEGAGTPGQRGARPGSGTVAHGGIDSVGDP